MEGTGTTEEGAEEDIDPLEQSEEYQAVEVDPTGRFARYNVVLGKGSSKMVYKAFDRVQGLEVAWNQVKMSDSSKLPAKPQLFSEVAVLRKLKHRNIMTFYLSWVDEHQRTLNFITEYFHPGTLRRYRWLHKCITLQVFKRWAWQILQGLVYLHGHDPPIVHRDLKCDNIFIHGVTGEIKIGDLGMAKLLTAGLSRAQSVLGTPEYMAPELYDERYNEKVDIYAYGMCLMELVTTEFPYMECDNRCQIFRKVTLGVYPAALARIEETEVRDFIELCITHDHRIRPSARELIKHPFFDSIRDEQALTSSFSYHSTSTASGTSEDVEAYRRRAGARSFHLQATEVQGNTLKFKLRMRNSEGSVQCLAFPFDAVSDTVDAVAQEMQEDFELTPSESEVFRSLLQEEVGNAMPLLQVGTKVSVPLPPVPAGGSSSAITGSCEETLSEIHAPTSASEQYLSTDAITSSVPDVFGSGLDSSCGEVTQPSPSVCYSGARPRKGGSEKHDVVIGEWLFRALYSRKPGRKIPVRKAQSFDSRYLRTNSLLRKPCSSEPCLVQCIAWDHKTRVVSHRMLRSQARPASGQKQLHGGAVYYTGSTYQVLEPSRAEASWKRQSVDDLPGASTSRQRGADHLVCKMHSSGCPQVVRLELSTPKCAVVNGATSCGNVSSPLSSPSLSSGHSRGEVVHREAGPLVHNLEQSLAGTMWGSNHRRTLSSSLRSRWQREGRVQGVCQWSQQEVQLLDLTISTVPMQLGWHTRNCSISQFCSRNSGADLPNHAPKTHHVWQEGSTEVYPGMETDHRALAADMECLNFDFEGQGVLFCLEKYTTVFHGKGSIHRLNAERHGSQQAVKEILRRMVADGQVKSGRLSAKSTAGGDDVKHLMRSASAPVTPSGSGISPQVLTTRHSSPCASIQRDKMLRRNLAMRVVRCRKAEQKLEGVESQILESLSLFRYSPGLCAQMEQYQNSSPIIPGLEAM